MAAQRLIGTWLSTWLTALPFRRVGDDRGATAVEYGLMIALIAIVIITAVALVGTNLKAVFETVQLHTALGN